MLVNLIDILQMAQEGNCAVGAFNTPNMESLNAVINAAEKLNVPVIISHAQVHEKLASLETIGPVLDLGLVKKISEITGLPLVMHGGSGVSAEDYHTGIANGLRKINYYSYMAMAGANAVKELLEKEDITFFHDLALAAEEAMERDVEKAMRIFAGK